MSARIKPRLTYANVVASIALFGVLAGGGAYAATKIGPKDIKTNAVRAKHIKGKQVRAKHITNNAVLTKHISDGAVDSNKLADDSVTSATVADDSLTGADIDEATLDGSLIDVRKVEGDDAVFLPQPATPGTTDEVVLIERGPLTVRAECANVAGAVEGRVTIENDNVEMALFKNSGTATVFPVTFPTTRHVIVSAQSGGPSFASESADYVAFTHAQGADSVGIGGQAAVLVALGVGAGCEIGAFGFIG